MQGLPPAGVMMLLRDYDTSISDIYIIKAGVARILLSKDREGHGH